ncbi:unnamed protein product [Phaeothamnion confervicola]
MAGGRWGKRYRWDMQAVSWYQRRGKQLQAVPNCCGRPALCLLTLNSARERSKSFGSGIKAVISLLWSFNYRVQLNACVYDEAELIQGAGIAAA